MAKYRKKPVVIEAEQFDPVHTPSPFGVVHRFGDHYVVETPEATIEVTPGDWIIRGVKGEYYPCHDDIFIATYERA